MSFIGTYKARDFNLSGLQGISDETLEMHFKLYEGYVKETNNEQPHPRNHQRRHCRSGRDARLFRTHPPIGI